MKLDFLHHLSYSNLVSFDSCPRCWYRHYCEGVEIPATGSMGLGKRVHEAIEDYHLKRINPESDELKKYIVAYSKRYKSKDYDEIEKLLEVPIFVNLGGANEVLMILMKVDRIWKGEIHDVKTSSSPWKQEDTNRRQTAFYAYGYRQLFGKKERKVVYDVLVKRSTPYLQTLEHQVTDSEIDEALNHLYETVEMWNKMPVPLEHSHNCKWGGIIR